jgi:hypothetical protein
MPLTHLYFRIAALSGNNLLLNADDGPGMVGTVLSVPTAIAPKASFTVHFDIGLQARQPFYFFIDAYGLLPGGRPAAAETDATVAALFDLSVDTAALVEPTTERLDNPVYLPLVNR